MQTSRMYKSREEKLEHYLNKMPNDQELTKDVRIALQAYDRYSEKGLKQTIATRFQRLTL